MGRRVITVFLVAGITLAGSSCGAAGPLAARAASGRPPTTLCGTQLAAVAGGSYVVQNNRYGTTAPECVELLGGTGFRVTRSSIVMPVDGGPGAYPSVYQGCHFGHCGSGGLATAKIQVATLVPGTVTTSWSTMQPASGAYDAAYDIWFGTAAHETGHPDCAELMVWLNHTGSVQPYGAPIALDVGLSGHMYDVWEGRQRWGDTITYTMTAGVTSVTGLDVGALAQDAVRRGYLREGCYLLDVEAGFEIWQAGTGLATTGFSVRLPSG
jgi:hypothetical protein